MSTFEEHLIAKIHPEVSPLWAVADGDGLFRSDEVARLLAARGAGILVYDDPMAFRFRYEHEVRPRLESAYPGCHVIVVDPENDGLRCLPADIYLASRHIEVALGDLFPSLSRKILRENCGTRNTSFLVTCLAKGTPRILSCVWPTESSQHS